jgi:hypothetical protein
MLKKQHEAEKNLKNVKMAVGIKTLAKQPAATISSGSMAPKKNWMRNVRSAEKSCYS